ncbi:MAG: hypothetical protein M0Z99_13300 [Betaproteobacteria bacterium]|nr:hypothetical protein [Betaproteobacteria bacterium]
MTLEKLKQQRENLKTRLTAIDAKIAKAEREAKEREARNLVKLIQSRGLTAVQVQAMIERGQA